MSAYPENYDDIIAQRAHDILKLPTLYWIYKNYFESGHNPTTGKSYSLVQDSCVVFEEKTYIDSSSSGVYSYYNYNCSQDICCGYDYSKFFTPSSISGDHEYGIWDYYTQQYYLQYGDMYLAPHFSADTINCPHWTAEYLSTKFDSLCGTSMNRCSMIQMSFSSNIVSRDTLNLIYGSPISTDPYTASYFEGNRAKNKEQIYHPNIFSAMMNNPPFILSESVMECKPPLYQSLIDTLGITVSNTAIISGLFLSVALSLSIYLFNNYTRKAKKICPTDKKGYISKQAMFALFEIIFKMIEKDENLTLRMKHQYEDLLHLLDATDQVDRLPIDEVIESGQSMASTGKLPQENAIKRLQVINTLQNNSRKKRNTIRPEDSLKPIVTESN